jgi:uncharacterized membrane protein YccC
MEGAAHRRLDRARQVIRAEGPQAARIVVAACVAWQVCLWLGAVHPPVYAVVVPVVALRADPFSASQVSFARLVGVVAGLCVGFLVLAVLQPGTAALAVVLALALAVAMAARVGGTINIQVAASALLVFASTQPDSYAVTRLWETVVGAVVTVVLAPLLFPPRVLVVLSKRLGALARDLGTGIDDAVGLLGSSAGTDSAKIRELRDLLVAAEERARKLPAELAAARRSLRVNPLRRGDRPAVEALAPGVAAAPGAARWVRLFAEEMIDFAGRGDVAAHRDRGQPALEAIGRSLRLAVDEALAARDPERHLDAAYDALVAYAASDPGRFAAVMRRPLHRLHDELRATSTPAP